jgi:hypothetical protein
MIQDPYALGGDDNAPREKRRWVSVVVPNPSRGRRLALLVGHPQCDMAKNHKSSRERIATVCL